MFETRVKAFIELTLMNLMALFIIRFNSIYFSLWYPLKSILSVEVVVVEKESEKCLVQGREQPLVSQSCSYSDQGSEKLALKKASLAYILCPHSIHSYGNFLPSLCQVLVGLWCSLLLSPCFKMHTLWRHYGVVFQDPNT